MSRKTKKTAYRSSKTNEKVVSILKNSEQHQKELNHSDIVIFCTTNYHPDDCQCPEAISRALNDALVTFNVGKFVWQAVGVGKIKPTDKQITILYITCNNPSYKEDVMKLLDIFIKYQSNILSDYIVDSAGGYELKRNPNSIIPINDGDFCTDYLDMKFHYFEKYRF